MQSLPPPQAGLDLITGSGFQWLTNLYLWVTGGSSQNVVSVTVPASASGYTVPLKGTLFVSGGTVSAISITRGSTTTALGITSGAIPVSKSDIVTFTYTGTPTVILLPR